MLNKKHYILHILYHILYILYYFLTLICPMPIRIALPLGRCGSPRRISHLAAHTPAETPQAGAGELKPAGVVSRDFDVAI